MLVKVERNVIGTKPKHDTKHKDYLVIDITEHTKRKFEVCTSININLDGFKFIAVPKQVKINNSITSNIILDDGVYKVVHITGHQFRLLKETQFNMFKYLDNNLDFNTLYFNARQKLLKDMENAMRKSLVMGTPYDVEKRKMKEVATIVGKNKIATGNHAWVLLADQLLNLPKPKDK